MKTLILDVVRKIDRPSFAEVTREIPTFRGGNHCLCCGGDENLIAWTNMTKEAVTALTELLRDEILNLRVTEQLTYLVDGMLPDLPTAKKYPEGGYKVPHWVPCVLIKGKNFPT